MKSLLLKDFRNALASFGPAMMLGIPLLLILQFSQDANSEKLTWQSAFWVAYFFSTTSLFFRSFGLENRHKNFQFYTAFRVPKLQIFFSQSLIHFLTTCILGLGYLLLVVVFWSPRDLNLTWFFAIIVLTSACLSPIGTVLGLMLQLEREFMFSVIYLPLATPVVLGAHALTTADFSMNWLFVLLSFLMVGGFVGAFVFEFFFDELSQSL
jgi:ABC-type transport system involved in cytochrome c biogenesis permease component